MPLSNATFKGLDREVLDNFLPRTGTKLVDEQIYCQL